MKELVLHLRSTDRHTEEDGRRLEEELAASEAIVHQNEVPEEMQGAAQCAAVT